MTPQVKFLLAFCTKMNAISSKSVFRICIPLRPVKSNFQFIYITINIFLIFLVFQKEVLTLLATIKEQNCQILTILKQNNKLVKTVKLPEDFPIQFPIQSQEQLEILEEYIINVDNLNSLVWINKKCLTVLKSFFK